MVEETTRLWVELLEKIDGLIGSLETSEEAKKSMKLVVTEIMVGRMLKSLVKEISEEMVTKLAGDLANGYLSGEEKLKILNEVYLNYGQEARVAMTNYVKNDLRKLVEGLVRATNGSGSSQVSA